MRGDAHRLGACRVRGLEIFDGADTGKQQHRDFGALHGAGDRFYPFDIAVRAESVVEARAGKAVAVADFDGVDAGLVERAGDALDLRHGVLVPDRVHPVAQRHVLNVQRLAAHAPTPGAEAIIASARRSPVRRAADVMMSRLPAYFGR